MRNKKQKFDQRGSYLPITRIEPNSIISEQYRKLRTNIELSDFNKKIQIVGITSTNQMEGKTLTAINLAEVYAQSGKKTLLIDMDLRKPKIHRGFRIINKKGLSDIFTKDYDINDVVEHVETNLDVLPSGSKLPYPAEFLSSEQLKTFVRKLKDIYERIIIDTPPMTAVADASIISSFCDGMLLVIASRDTEIHITKDVIKDLENNGAHIIGSVLTRVSKRDSRYMNYYYYQYH
jgi:capsular exopolysaccharide synthesis family protein